MIKIDFFPLTIYIFLSIIKKTLFVKKKRIPHSPKSVLRQLGQFQLLTNFLPDWSFLIQSNTVGRVDRGRRSASYNFSALDSTSSDWQFERCCLDKSRPFNVFVHIKTWKVINTFKKYLLDPLSLQLQKQNIYLNIYSVLIFVFHI